MSSSSSQRREKAAHRLHPLTHVVLSGLGNHSGLVLGAGELTHPMWGRSELITSSDNLSAGLQANNDNAFLPGLSGFTK